MKIRKILFTILTLLSATVLISGCNKDEDVDVYASIYPLYYITREIAKDRLNVKQVYPNGADVHEYDPGNASALVQMSRADIMFYIGKGLEGFIEKAKVNIFSNSNINMVELSDYVVLCEQTSTGYKEADEIAIANKAVDCHLWLDPERMITFAKTIGDNLISAYPQWEEFFKANQEALILKLQELDNAYEKVFFDEDINPIILVDHDAYLYLEARYGLKRIRIRTDNESCDVIPTNMTSNINLAKDNNIKYIITTKNEKVCEIVKTYQSAISADVVELNHLATLTTDEIENNEDYISIMYKNLEKFKTILPKKVA